MDEVSQFMSSTVQHPTPQYVLDSEWVLGQRIETTSFFLIYRQEGDRLILCDFGARESDGTAVLSLSRLLRNVITAVPHLRYIDAMILPSIHEHQLNELRQRLTSFMVKQGAQPVYLDDGLWLRLICGS